MCVRFVMTRWIPRRSYLALIFFISMFTVIQNNGWEIQIALFCSLFLAEALLVELTAFVVHVYVRGLRITTIVLPADTL